MASYIIIDRYKSKKYSIKMICEVLEVSRSSYYKYKNRIKPDKENQDELVGNLILEYHSTFDGILGYRRMTMFINRLNHFSYSEGYIHRLMKKMKISARIRRQKVNRSRNVPEHTKDNILQRNFKSNAPNEKWLTDVTEFSITSDSRKLYLSPIMDLYDNSIVAYELSLSNNAQVVFKMFEKAMASNPEAKPILHSDRGFQYTSIFYKEKLEETGVTQSMSRVGKCIDNGPMEGFFGSLKTEMFYGKKFSSIDELKNRIKAYIDFYNNNRFQKRLNCSSPIEYRNQYNCA